MERLRYDIMSLARCVTAIDYKFANSFLSAKYDSPRPRGKWSQIISTDQGNYYTYLSPDGSSGRYSSDLPDGVNSEDVAVVHRFSDPDYGKQQIDESLKLLKQFAGETKIHIPGSLEEIELTDPDPREIETLWKILSGTRQSIESGYNENIIFQLSQPIMKAITQTRTEGIAVLQKNLFEVTDNIAAFRKSCAIDGKLAAWFLVYRDICSKIHEHYGKIRDKKAADTEFIRLVSFGSDGTIKDPSELLRMTVEKLVREGSTGLVDSTAMYYLQQGEHFIEQSLESKSFEEHHANLYESILFLFASHQMYSLLVAATKGLEEYFREYKKIQKVVNEKMVRVEHALAHAVMNRTGDRLRDDRANIEKARQKKGKIGVSQKVFELIEMFYFYPRYFESSLKNENYS